MRNLEELKTDLKKHWIDNDKDFEKLIEKISFSPYNGGITYAEYYLLKGNTTEKKANKLVKEWEKEEKPLPRMVMVRDNDNDSWVEQKLISIIQNDLKYRYVCESLLKSGEYPVLWQQMKEIEEVPEYTVEDLTEKLGHEFKIKK